MKKYINYLFLIIWVFLINLYGGEGETGVPALMMDSYGAREMALGDTFAGIADDVNTISVNPAGLNTLNSIEGSIMYLKYPLDMSFGHLSFGMPISKKSGSFGIAIAMFALPDFEQYDSIGNIDSENLSASDFVISLGYANNPLKLFGIERNLNLGLSLKYIKSKLVEAVDSGIGIDIGILYKIGVIGFGRSKVKDNLGIGLAIQNLGSSMRYGNEETYLPGNIRIGIGWNSYNDEKNKVLFGFDINIPDDSDTIVSTGIEYSYIDMVFARIGYKFSGIETDSISLGIGFKYKLGGKKFGLDYAFIPLKDLGDMHSFTLSVKF